MTSLLLAATLLCPISVPPGIHRADITAKYLHEQKPGVPYVFTGGEYVTGAHTVVTAEGHPWYLEVIVGGKPVAKCVGQHAIHIDGFETGDLRYWHGR